MSQRAGKGGGARKIGTRTEKCKRYAASGRREKGKIKRALKSCGYAFAQALAQRYGQERYLASLIAG
jgi:hypothetical protein